MKERNPLVKYHIHGDKIHREIFLFRVYNWNKNDEFLNCGSWAFSTLLIRIFYVLINDFT